MTPRILVLEDDPRMLEVLSQVLEDQGFEVTRAARAKEAVEHVSRQPFDLIVADIRMEGMSGLDAVELSRRQQPDLGTLIVSGFATPENTARAMKLQAGKILKKPFSLKVFLERVREELSQRQQAAAAGARRRGYQSGLLWAVETLVKQMSLPARPVNSEVYTELGERLAAELGLSDDVCREVGLACALASSELAQSIPQEFLKDTTTLPTLKYCLGPGGDEARLEGRIVHLVTHAIDEDWSPGEPFASSADLVRAGVGPDLLPAYEKALQSEGDSRAPSSGAPDLRHLLGLAHTLRDIGHLESARDAYGKVLEQARGRQQIQAQLGWARLELQSGQMDEVSRLTQLARQVAEKSGPVTHATTLLEIGLLEFRGGLESADTLKRAANDLARLGFDGSVALATVALMTLGHQPNPEQVTHYLEALSAPRYFQEVLASSEWLVPKCLELMPSLSEESHRRAVLKLVTLFPAAVSVALRSGVLDRPQKLQLLGQLAGCGTGLEVLESLAQDPDAEVAKKAHQLLSQHSGVATPQVLRCRSFGVFQVFLDAEPVPDKHWQTKKVRYYLAYLANHWGTYLSEDAIMDCFWPTKSRDRAKQNLYWSNSSVRRCLSKSGAEFEAELIERRDESLRLNPELAHWHDVQEFEKAFESARAARGRGELQQARVHYSTMAEIYRGPYLEGYYLDWAVRRRDQLEQQLLRGLCELAECCLELNDGMGALEASLRAVELDPAHQQGHLLAMKAHLALSEPQAALQQFEECRRVLDEEYGLEPTTDMVKLASSVGGQH